MWHIIENVIRIELDTYGYGDLKMIADEKYSWKLYRDTDQVGTAYYNIEHVIIKILP